MLGTPPVSALAATVAAVTVRITFKNVFSLLLAVVFVIVLALVSGRLVGITVGRWRSVATALVGTLIGAAGAEAVVRGTNDTTVAYALTALFGVLATMVLMIIPEAVGPPPVRRPPAPVEAPLAPPGAVAPPHAWPRWAGRGRCFGRPAATGWPGRSSCRRRASPPPSSAAASA